MNNKFKNMDRKDVLKETDIKNRTCYYFDDIIRIEEISIIFQQMKNHILVYNISYKSLIDAKPLRIMLDKIDGFITVYV